MDILEVLWLIVIILIVIILIIIVIVIVVIVIVCFIAHLAPAAPLDDDATCDISVTVDSIMEWAGNFTAISLTAISFQADAPQDSETQTIYTNCDLNISADNTVAAELSSATDVLITKYQLAQDGDGALTTGATGADETTSGIATWTEYDTFLDTVLPITHIDTDGAVQITLSVQATNNAGEVADSGAYSAQQTLTAIWTSD